MENKDLSKVFEVVGGRLRTNFVLALKDGPLRPAQLSQKLDAPISNLYRIFNDLKHAGLVESFEKDGLVYWSLTEFGERWINANIEAITGTVRKDVKESFWNKHKISLIVFSSILLFSGIRALLASEPTWFLGGIILSIVVYLIIEKIK
ncbi:MAG: helix-turn-helix domain-containing protein [Nitrososphaeria archaeon]|nr:helix-turn-helix domain-containing protein [Nitrososphaeria archaeon]